MEIFEANRRFLSRYLRRQLGSYEDAQDLAQETYLRLLELPHCDQIREPQSYLFRIASNLVYHLRRAEKRNVVIADSSLLAYHCEHLADRASIDPATQIEVGQQLKSVLSRLPSRHAEILMLRKRDGFSHAEIAERLGLSIHTVKKYLSRAVAQIRNKD